MKDLYLVNFLNEEEREMINELPSYIRDTASFMKKFEESHTSGSSNKFHEMAFLMPNMRDVDDIIYCTESVYGKRLSISDVVRSVIETVASFRTLTTYPVADTLTKEEANVMLTSLIDTLEFSRVNNSKEFFKICNDTSNMYLDIFTKYLDRYWSYNFHKEIIFNNKCTNESELIHLLLLLERGSDVYDITMKIIDMYNFDDKTREMLRSAYYHLSKEANLFSMISEIDKRRKRIS